MCAEADHHIVAGQALQEPSQTQPTYTLLSCTPPVDCSVGPKQHPSLHPAYTASAPGVCPPAALSRRAELQQQQEGEQARRSRGMTLAVAAAAPLTAVPIGLQLACCHEQEQDPPTSL